ncbi:retrotransposon protein [Tanacetum coccineum]|uniref:Retrotransposon protein n=1 Tax=Tanacetum coccineum TaxID=301880 RepID=A0ABQ5AUQ6_9ASTR
MSKVLQERGFGSLPNSTETNPRDQVKSISTATIRRMETSPYAVSVPQHIHIFSETVPFLRRLHDYCCDDWKEARGAKILEAYDHNLSQKEKDPGSFTLPCFINNICFDKTLVDLGASVSGMPFSTYTNLGLEVLSHTRLTIELADRTIKQPRGIAENVLVRIGKFVFSIDFIILDIPKDEDVPLILRRPFLSTAHVKIDLFKRKVTLRDNGRCERAWMSIPSLRPCMHVSAALLDDDLRNYGVICEDEAKRRNSETKMKTFKENCYLLPYAISNKEDTAYQRQLITRIRVMINSRFSVSLLTHTPYAQLVVNFVDETEEFHSIKEIILPQLPRIVYPPILNIIYFRHFLDIHRNYDPIDDEPMWAADRVVALTPDFAITIPKTANKFAIKAGGIFFYKTPNQAYQLLEDKVLLKLDWAKNQKTKSSLKKTVAFTDEGNSNSDTDKIMARIDAMTIKMDAQYKELQSHAKN